MKRIAWILVPLLVLPLIALSLLSWSLAGQAEDRLIRAEQARHVELAAAFERRLDDALGKLANALDRWSESVAGRSSDTPPPDLVQAWTIVFEPSGRWWYPPRYATDRAIGKESAPGSPTAAAAIEQLGSAVRQERTPATIELAAQEYAALDHDTVPRSIRAQALLGLARCARAANQPERAADLYRRLQRQYADVSDEAGVNVGAEAGRAYLALAADTGRDGATRQVWRDHVDALLAGRYPMAWALTLAHLTDARASAPLADVPDEDLSRRRALREAVGRLEAMSQAVTASAARPRHTALELKGDHVLLWHPVLHVKTPAWVVASFATTWVGTSLVGAQLNMLDLGESTAACLQNEHGASVAGVPIEPAARTTELLLSRWGLPWTLSVGFSDLDRVRARATRRHALLTGSIAMLLVLITIGSVIGWRMVRREMELSQMKSDFVDNVSHELRTPVTSIKMFSQMLATGQVGDPQRQQEYYRLLTSESNRLARMVENMLNFSRMVANKMRITRSPTDMTEYLPDLARDLQLQARPTGHRIRLQLASDLPICAIDRDAVSRAVANLVSNAIKYSPDEREITLTALRRDAMLSLTVRDRGVGIPEAELPYVFDRFYRVRQPDSDHVQGTGLGLTIVKDTVERHGGKVHITSRIGEGTVVELLFPIEIHDP